MAEPTLSATETRVLSVLLERALKVPYAEREAWLAALPEAQRTLLPRLRERLERIAPPPPDAAPPPPPAVNYLQPRAGSRHGERVGPYRLLHEIGAGRHGAVWLAEPAEGTGHHRPVALRWVAGVSGLPRPRPPGSPAIVAVHDVGTDAQGRPWRAMAHVEGVNLVEHAQRRRLDVVQRVQLLVQVCALVGQAHAARGVRAEIKPGSLRVDDDGQLRLLDWGLGVPLQPAAAATEVAALGELLQRLLAAGPAAGAALPAVVGPELRAVLQRSLDADPARRYASVAELAADLQRVLDLRPVQARPAPPWRRARLFAVRHRRALAFGALALALLAGAGSVFFGRWQRSQAQLQRLDEARAFVAEVLQGADALAPGAAPADAATQAQRAQSALVQARTGFEGQPVLRGLVLGELALRFRRLGQPEQALAVLREAHTLLKATAAPADPALHLAAAQLALQLRSSTAADAAAQSRELATQVLAACDGSGCEGARAAAQAALATTP